jgi:hypothetical protein
MSDPLVIINNPQQSTYSPYGTWAKMVKIYCCGRRKKETVKRESEKLETRVEPKRSKKGE